MQRAFYLILAAAVAVAAAYLVLTSRRDDAVRVGAKKFTEGYIMAEMIGALLRARGYAVEERFDMGSGVLRQALEHGQVDLYWEYTGTAYLMHQQGSDPEVMADRRRVYEAVKAADAPLGLVWLEPARINNTYTLMMTRERAEALAIRTISDLARYVGAHPEGVSLASNAEWFARPDGFQGLGAHYGFRFPPERVLKMEAGLIYRALRDGVVDVGMGYATDARIAALDLRNLEDDRGFFPVYNPAPVIRSEVLERHPELEGLLAAMARRLDDATITRLNAEVDIGRRSAENVAREWLEQQGLL